MMTPERTVGMTMAALVIAFAGFFATKSSNGTNSSKQTLRWASKVAPPAHLAGLHCPATSLAFDAHDRQPVAL